MSTIVPPGITPTGERVEREIPGIGLLVFENYGPGEWLTKRGEPAKKSRRRYLLDGVELDSVSSVVGALDKPQLQRWIEDQATRGAVQAERMGELQGVPEEDWCDRVRLLNLGASAKRDRGADRGTIIHSALDGLTRGIVPNPAAVPGVARPWLRGVSSMWLKLKPRVLCSEQIVCNPDLGYAGRFDLIAVIDGAVTLLDWKTGKGRVFDQAHYQTRLYSMAKLREGVKVDRVCIVGIDDDGGFQLVDCEASEADAKALLDVYRSRKRINSGMAAQRRLLKAAA